MAHKNTQITIAYSSQFPKAAEINFPELKTDTDLNHLHIRIRPYIYHGKCFE